MSLQGLWEADKRFIRNSPVNIKWQNPLPSPEEARETIIESCRLWTNPPNPVNPDKDSILSLADKVKPIVQDIYGAEIPANLRIEVHEYQGYLARISELEDEVNAEFGDGLKCQSAPISYFSPFHNIILFPIRFIARIPKGEVIPDRDNGIFQDNWHIQEYPWGMVSLELNLAYILSNAMFRNLRGEIGNNYVSSLSAVTQVTERAISDYNSVMGLLTEEIMARQNPDQQIHVAAEKFKLVWADRLRRNVVFV